MACEKEVGAVDIASVRSQEVTNANNEKDRAPLNPVLEEYLAMEPADRAAFDKKLLRRMDLHLIPWMT